MRLTAITFAGALMACSAVHAQQAVPSCAAYTKAADDQLKQIAYSGLSGGYAYMQVNLAALNANLAAMAASKCPMPAKPIRIDAYDAAARACRDSNDAASAQCDRSRWVRPD